MSQIIIYPASSTPVLLEACHALQAHNIRISADPTEEVTHLLLGAPAFESDGSIKGGGNLPELLTHLPSDLAVIGGNLTHPALKGYEVFDLLKDETYLAKNAAITAHCAITQAWSRLPVIPYRCPVLVIGWGRIGKCLADLLSHIGAYVTVAARKETDLAMISALGFNAVPIPIPEETLSAARVIFNTAPVTVITSEQASSCSANCLKIDLASAPGISGDNIYWARGLPGKYAPESSGNLIAETVLKHLRSKELIQ